MQPKPQESDCLSKKKKGSYIVPKELEKVRDDSEAQERLDDAPEKVPDEVHFDREGQWTTTTP
jgi:hypothetical protein